MGKVVLKLGKDISTDDIYPGRFMATVLPTETPQFCFNDRTDFNAKLKAKAIPPGSVIVADENFGCGSSREQATSAIKGHELEVRDGKVANLTTGKTFAIVPLPPARQAIIDAGGLIPFTRKRLLALSPR